SPTTGAPFSPSPRSPAVTGPASSSRPTPTSPIHASTLPHLPRRSAAKAGSRSNVSLLADVRQIFAQSGRTRLTSKEVLESLCALPDRPWASAVRASPSEFNWLASQLRPLGIVSHNIRLGAQRAKGYDLSDFAAAF